MSSGVRFATLIFGLFFIGFFILQQFGGQQNGSKPAVNAGNHGAQTNPNKLIVAMRNAPTIWYEGPEGPSGIEYELVQQFANFTGQELEILEVGSAGAALAATSDGRAHIAAAGITRTEARESVYKFGPDFQQIQQEVVCNRDGKRPKNLSQLQEVKLTVVAQSSYAEQLAQSKIDNPKISWQETDDQVTEQLLEQVWREELECTVADSNIVAMNRRYFPELDIAFPLSEQQALAWVVPDSKLRRRLSKWFEKIEDNGQLAALRDKYYGYTEIFDYVDLRAYHRRIKERLPKFRKAFTEAGAKHGVPWTLIAAQGYQESHWDPKAKSPTGVRGIMMLTKNTANHLGVKDRLNAKASINGGAKYLAETLARVPASVTNDEDRLRFALAAYNIGMAHMYDAQTLAEKLGKNPATWAGLKEVLPLLADKKYYSTLKRGYARGSEPVRYIERIDNYRDILEASLR